MLQASCLSRLSELRTLKLDFDNHAGSPARVGLSGLPHKLRSLTLGAYNALMLASLPATVPNEVLHQPCPLPDVHICAGQNAHGHLNSRAGRPSCVFLLYLVLLTGQNHRPAQRRDYRRHYERAASLLPTFAEEHAPATSAPGSCHSDLK